jgi:hypothetical protein
MEKALEQLRQVEKDVWERNRRRTEAEPDTQKDEDEYFEDPDMSHDGHSSWVNNVAMFMYAVYTWIFYCRRNVMNTLFHDETKERQKLIIEIPLPKHPWMCVSGVVGDDEYDVTDVVNENLAPGERLTYEWLTENAVIPDPYPEKVVWEYIDSSTFEVHEITSEGVVNEVKPKTD